MRPRKNNTPEGIFGTQGFINPRARRREVGDSEFSVSRLMRTIGEASKNAKEEKKLKEPKTQGSFTPAEKLLQKRSEKKLVRTG